MHSSKRRRGAAFGAVLALLASCMQPLPETGGKQPEVAGGNLPGSTAVCRVGTDGGPAIVDRGIGGTGVAAGDTRTADRGIGGTGAASGAITQQVDRGIGGTGIIGIVTGFASICLDGREIALTDTVPVLVDGQSASTSVLRAGQLATVEATGPATALEARHIAIRHEVSGPVEAIESNGILRVAGQHIAISGETWGDRSPQRGEWVAVSGLRQPGGMIAATRIDRRPVGGSIIVRGPLSAGPDGTLRVGAMEVPSVAGVPAVTLGQYVTAFGRREGDVLVAKSIVPDILAEDPVAYFGRHVGRVILESYVSSGGNGRLQLGSGRELPASLSMGPVSPGRSIVELERRGASAFVTNVSPNANGGREGPDTSSGNAPGSSQRSGPGGGAPASGTSPGGRPRGQAPFNPVPSQGFGPAPVPDRRFDGDRSGFGAPGNGPGLAGPGSRDSWSNPGPFGAGPPTFGPGPGGPGQGGSRGH